MKIKTIHLLVEVVERLQQKWSCVGREAESHPSQNHCHPGSTGESGPENEQLFISSRNSMQEPCLRPSRVKLVFCEKVNLCISYLPCKLY